MQLYYTSKDYAQSGVGVVKLNAKREFIEFWRCVWRYKLRKFEKN